MSESDLASKLEKLQQENKQLLHNCDHVEKLKAEKEELNEKLKTAMQQVNKNNVLETERDHLKKENEELSKELRTIQNENSSFREKLKHLEENETVISKNIETLNSVNENLKSELVALQNSSKSEKDSLLLEKEKLLNRIQQLESCVSNTQDASVQDYLESLKKEYEAAIKAKDDDMLNKLKQLVKDFSIQMDVKDKDSEQMINELIGNVLQSHCLVVFLYVDIYPHIIVPSIETEILSLVYQELHSTFAISVILNKSKNFE